MAIDADSRTFHLEQYKCLRAEVVAQGAKYDQLKVWLLAGLGGYYAWIISTIFGTTSSAGCNKLNDATIDTLVLIPIGITIITTMSAGFFASYFDKIAGYFRDVEHHLGIGALAWQAKFGVPAESPRWPGFRALSDPFFMIVLLSTSVVSGVIFTDTRDTRLCPTPVVVLPAAAANPATPAAPAATKPTSP